MGNKIQLKLNSSTGVTRGLLRFASDKEWKQVLVLKQKIREIIKKIQAEGVKVSDIKATSF